MPNAPEVDADVEILDDAPPIGAEDLARGRAVLTDWGPRLAAQAESTTFTGLNGTWVGFGVLQGVQTIRATPGLEARLRRMPAEVYDISTFDDLEPGALALQVVSRDLADARVGQSRARVPLSLSELATNHRRRLVKMCEWEAIGDASFEAFVTDVKRGRGIVDTINDLARLAPALRKRRAAFEKNRLYRADDAEVAERLAGELGRALIANLSPEAQALRSLQLKLNTLLDRAWRHTQRAIALLRADEPDLLPTTLRAQTQAVRG